MTAMGVWSGYQPLSVIGAVNIETLIGKIPQNRKFYVGELKYIIIVSPWDK